MKLQEDEETVPRRHVRFWGLMILLPGILLAQVFVYQPFFGHMDDGRMLDLVAAGDFTQNLSDYALYHERRYGYYGATAFSMLLVLPIYQIGQSFGALAFYAINAAIVGGIVIAFMYALSRAGLFDKSLLPVAVAAVFLWPFSVELIFYPGLQEKGVILAIALLTWWIHRGITVRSNTIFWSVTIGLFVLSATTKTQVVVYLPAIGTLALALRNEYPNKTRPSGIAVIVIITTAFIALAGLSGTYSGSQRTGSLITNAMLPYSLVILTVALGYAIYLGVRVMYGKHKLLDFVPLVMMTTMWVAIIYFGYRNYFLSIFGPMFGAAIAVIIGHMKSHLLQRVATTVVLASTIAWVLFRIPQVFLPLHGIGAFTQGDIVRDLALEHATVYASCAEGAGHFRRYTERKWGISPDFRPLEGQGAYGFGIPVNANYIFGDRRLCPAPPEASAWTVVWASGGDDGFRLYKRPSEL